MPQRKRLEDELREVWDAWSAPPDYGLWHEHKKPTVVDTVEENLGLVKKELPAPEPIDLAPNHGGGGSAAAAAKANEEDEWGDKPSKEVKQAREKSVNGPGGYVKRGRTLNRTPAKSRPTRSVSFSDKQAGEMFRQMSAFIKQADVEASAADSKRIPVQRAARARAAKAKKAEAPPNILEVKKRKKRAPKTTETVPA